MKEYTINLTQRTSLGNDNGSKTKIHVVRWTMHGDICMSNDPRADFDRIPEDAYEVVACVTICHPIIMGGSPEEALSYFCRATLTLLKQRGHIKTYNGSLNFWALDQ